MSSSGSPQGMARHALQSLVRPEQWFLGMEKNTRCWSVILGAAAARSSFRIGKWLFLEESAVADASKRDGLVGGAECVGRASGGLTGCALV